MCGCAGLKCRGALSLEGADVLVELRRPEEVGAEALSREAKGARRVTGPAGWVAERRARERERARDRRGWVAARRAGERERAIDAAGRRAHGPSACPPSSSSAGKAGPRTPSPPSGPPGFLESERGGGGRWAVGRMETVWLPLWVLFVQGGRPAETPPGARAWGTDLSPGFAVSLSAPPAHCRCRLPVCLA